MSKREEFHEILVALLGSRNVYFQPPATVKMQYPCIVYKRSQPNVLHADDHTYNNRQGYLATVIDANPDSSLLGKMVKMPLCRFERHYTSDNLNHDVYNIYY